MFDRKERQIDLDPLLTMIITGEISNLRYILRDQSIEDSEDLPVHDIIIKEIAENLESALETICKHSRRFNAR